MKINLSDTTTLEALFNEVDSWGNLPTSSLSPQQIALLNLKHTAFTPTAELKNGGSCSGSALCFICFTGA